MSRNKNPHAWEGLFIKNKKYLKSVCLWFSYNQFDLTEKFSIISTLIGFLNI